MCRHLREICSIIYAHLAMSVVTGNSYTVYHMAIDLPQKAEITSVKTIAITDAIIYLNITLRVGIPFLQ